MPHEIHQLEVFADYSQFYLCDSTYDDDTSAIWTDEALDRQLGVHGNHVVIGTARNMDVPVTLEIHDAEPIADFDDWERVVECGIAVPSGELALAGCTDYFPASPRFAVTPGRYLVRVSWAGLTLLSEDGLDGEDRYRVQLWLGDLDGVVIRKA